MSTSGNTRPRPAANSTASRTAQRLQAAPATSPGDCCPIVTNRPRDAPPPRTAQPAAAEPAQGPARKPEPARRHRAKRPPQHPDTRQPQLAPCPGQSETHATAGPAPLTGTPRAAKKVGDRNVNSKDRAYPVERFWNGPDAGRIVWLCSIAAAATRDWPVLAEAVAELARLDAVPAAMQAWTAATADRITRGRPPGSAFAFDETTIAVLSLTWDLPDLGQWIQVPASRHAALQVTPADVADAVRISCSLASQDPATSQALLHAMLTRPQADTARLMAAAAFTTAMFAQTDPVLDLRAPDPAPLSRATEKTGENGADSADPGMR